MNCLFISDRNKRIDLYLIVTLNFDSFYFFTFPFKYHQLYSLNHLSLHFNNFQRIKTIRFYDTCLTSVFESYAMQSRQSDKAKTLVFSRWEAIQPLMWIQIPFSGLEYLPCNQ